MIPLRDENRSRRVPFINYFLIGANLAVFVLQLARGQALDRFAAYPNEISHGRDLYTVFTSMFMHGGFMHIIGNMWFLYVFGDNVEDGFGHFPYLLFYLAAGAAGAMLQVFVSRNSGVPMVGASGAISGVLGAYMVMYPGARVLTLLPIFIFIQLIYIPAFVFLGFWIVLQLLSGFGTSRTGGGIAFFAHIGGFAVGFVVALFVRLFRPRRRVRYVVY